MIGELLRITVPYTDVPVIVPIALISLWLLLRSRATDLASSSALDKIIGRGRPVVLEFFKNT